MLTIVESPLFSKLWPIIGPRTSWASSACSSPAIPAPEISCRAPEAVARFGGRAPALEKGAASASYLRQIAEEMSDASS